MKNRLSTEPMKPHNSSSNSNPKPSSSFFQNLQQKYMSHKNNQNSNLSQNPTNRCSVGSNRNSYFGSATQSYFTSNTGSTNHSRMKENTGKKNRSISQCSVKTDKDKCKQSQKINTFVCVTDLISQEQRQKLQNQHNITMATTSTLQISSSICQQYPKMLSILIKPIPIPIQKSTKSIHIYKHLQPLLKQFQKSTLCIYSLGNKNNEFYDMLSIRKQIKKEIKLLVQTNICNNSKSSTILKKLIDVAVERQKSMIQCMDVRAVVVRVKAVVGVNVQDQNRNDNFRKQGERGDNEVEIEMSVGDYGEIGIKDLMGAEKMRKYITIVDAQNIQNVQQLYSQLLPLKKKEKPQKQSELLLKIRNLQQQLHIKKKELEQQKQRVANEQAIEAQLQDIVLPSERPMINIKKYCTKYNVRYGRNKDTNTRDKNQLMYWNQQQEQF